MNLFRHVVKPSTRAFGRAARKVAGFSFLDLLHAHVYMRWLYEYISVATGKHGSKQRLRLIWKPLGRLIAGRAGKAGPAFKRTFADSYHGKVVPVELARELVAVNQEVTLRDLERVVPFARARDIVLRNPDHIVALECPCRSLQDTPCMPLDVCLVIGEPFAGFVAEHHPRRSRWISPGDAIDILTAEHHRGHVHHAFFKDAMLGRFYAICNCCSCCCGAMQAYRNGYPMLASSGFVSRVETDECQACGTCAEFCPFEAMTMGPETVVIDESVCMGCGVCVSKCQLGALRLERDPKKGEPLAIKELLSAGGGGCPAEALVVAAAGERQGV